MTAKVENTNSEFNGGVAAGTCLSCHGGIRRYG